TRRTPRQTATRPVAPIQATQFQNSVTVRRTPSSLPVVAACAPTARHMRSRPSTLEMTPATRAVLILIAATLVARIVFGFSLGLGIDESYTVATGRHPHLSTFDHPPAAWWLAWG